MVLYAKRTIVVTINPADQIGATIGEILFYPVATTLRRGEFSGARVIPTVNSNLSILQL